MGKDKAGMELDLRDARLDLEDAVKGKAELDKQGKLLQAAIVDANTRLDEMARALNEAESTKKRLQVENQDLNRQIEELENAIANMNKAKISVTTQLEDTKSLSDAESKDRASLLTKYKMMSTDLENLREKLENEAMRKSRFETEGMGRIEELEGARNKLQAKIVENEELVDVLTTKVANAEKSKGRQAADLDDLSMEYERVHAAALITEKRAKNFDKVLGEWQSKAADLAAEISASQDEGRNYSSELFRLKAAQQEATEQLDVVKRENKNLADEIKDLLDQLGEGGRSIHALDKQRRMLETEKEELQGALEEAEATLEKEEEFNNTRKTKAFKKQLAAEAEAEKAALSAEEAELAAALEKKDDGVCRIMFDPPHYTVMESVGTFEVTVAREGGDMSQTIQVDYKTEDGTASHEGDYIEAIGTLTFGPGETQKMVTLEVLDDDVFEEDEHFYIRISNLRRKDGKPFKEIEVEGEDGKKTMQANCQLGTPHMATIMILDDDHSGIFGFEDSEAEIVESVGTYELKVQRISGARGKVGIPYNTEDGTAKEGVHYDAQEGELMFLNEETEKIISIAITDEESYEKSLILYVSIGEPRHIADGTEGEGVDYAELDAKDPEELTEEEKIALLGRPCLGANTKIQIRIKESKEFKNSVDKMMQKANNSMMVGSSSWLEQFSDAFTVQADDDEEEEGEEGEEKMPSCGDYIMHFLTLPWKLIFAFIPPTAIYSGYPTFVIAIFFIGACTAVIGDIAGHLGCFIYLKDCVNAIAFVALGTSVPDTFASKTAAIEDETADASVGNVTGSNAVNVFLGIGIAWTMAAIYWEAQGEVFKVEPGSLGFSVTIFCIEALLAILILMLRRSPVVGGELGGPKLFKTISSSIFVFFWCFYVAISALEAYGVIKPGF